MAEGNAVMISILTQVSPKPRATSTAYSVLEMHEHNVRILDIDPLPQILSDSSFEPSQSSEIANNNHSVIEGAFIQGYKALELQNENLSKLTPIKALPFSPSQVK